MIIIDYIDNLELTDDEEKKHFNELRSLDYLARGLEFLYNNVKLIEATITERLPKDKKVFMWGDAPKIRDIPQGLVACAFHWYAVTICNYVKMVGWLAYSEDSSKARNYLEQVIQPVKLWRDKVGAHFARIDPKSNKDTPADLAMSVMFPISFYNDAFYTGSLRLRLSSGGKSSVSRDMRWSLTHTHRDLIPRYWPPKPNK